MKRYLEADIALIKEERKKHKYSFYHLSHIHGIPSSTIRNWCYEDKIHTKGDVLRAFHLRKREAIKQSEIEKYGPKWLDNLCNSIVSDVLAFYSSPTPKVEKYDIPEKYYIKTA